MEIGLCLLKPDVYRCLRCGLRLKVGFGPVVDHYDDDERTKIVLLKETTGVRVLCRGDTEPRPQRTSHMGCYPEPRIFQG